MSTIYLPQTRYTDSDGRPAWHTTTDHGYFHTQDAIEVYIATMRYPEEWSWEEVELTTPLDPEPWQRWTPMGTDRAAKLDRRVPHSQFAPRTGYEPRSEAYGVRGGIDPYPYEDRHPTNPDAVLKGQSRFPDLIQGRARNAVRHFDPRPGFEQNEEMYR